jgi:hypothetical protein
VRADDGAFDNLDFNLVSSFRCIEAASFSTRSLECEHCRVIAHERMWNGEPHASVGIHFVPAVFDVLLDIENLLRLHIGIRIERSQRRKAHIGAALMSAVPTPWRHAC